MIPIVNEYYRITKHKNKLKRSRLPINEKWTQFTKTIYINSTNKFLRGIVDKYGIQKGGGGENTSDLVRKIGLEHNTILTQQRRGVLKNFPKYYITSKKNRKISQKVYSGLVDEAFSYIHYPLKKQDMEYISDKAFISTLLYIQHDLSKRGKQLDSIIRNDVTKLVKDKILSSYI